MSHSTSQAEVFDKVFTIPAHVTLPSDLCQLSYDPVKSDPTKMNAQKQKIIDRIKEVCVRPACSLCMIYTARRQFFFFLNMLFILKIWFRKLYDIYSVVVFLCLCMQYISFYYKSSNYYDKRIFKKHFVLKNLFSLA